MAIKTVPFTFFETFELHPKTQQPRKRDLLYDLNALADFEQEVGMGFAQLMQMKAAFATVRAIVWSGLKWQDRALTIERAGELIGEYVRGSEDGSRPGGDINDMLSHCIETAVNQGALGRPKTPEAESSQPALPGSVVATLETTK